MKRFVFLMLITTLLFPSCTSFQTNSGSYTYSSDIENTDISSNRGSNETPAEFESRMQDVIIPAIWSTHYGTLRDPIPIGEYAEWGIYHENRLLNERTDYTIRMNVNYSVRGEKALELYNTYSKEVADYEAATSRYYYDDYERYIPKNGNELIIINITMEVDSEENKPLPLAPSDFSVATSSGVKIPGGKNYDWDYFEYYNLIDYEVYPEGEAEGYLVYEIPQGKDVYLEFAGVWFKVE